MNKFTLFLGLVSVCLSTIITADGSAVQQAEGAIVQQNADDVKPAKPAAEAISVPVAAVPVEGATVPTVAAAPMAESAAANIVLPAEPIAAPATTSNVVPQVDAAVSVPEKPADTPALPSSITSTPVMADKPADTLVLPGDFTSTAPSVAEKPADAATSAIGAPAVLPVASEPVPSAGLVLPGDGTSVDSSLIADKAPRSLPGAPDAAATILPVESSVLPEAASSMAPAVVSAQTPALGVPAVVETVPAPAIAAAASSMVVPVATTPKIELAPATENACKILAALYLQTVSPDMSHLKRYRRLLEGSGASKTAAVEQALYWRVFMLSKRYMQLFDKAFPAAERSTLQGEVSRLPADLKTEVSAVMVSAVERVKALEARIDFLKRALNGYPASFQASDKKDEAPFAYAAAMDAQMIDWMAGSSLSSRKNVSDMFDAERYRLKIELDILKPKVGAADYAKHMASSAKDMAGKAASSLKEGFGKLGGLFGRKKS